MTRKGQSHYLTSKAKTEELKYPVGKVAGDDSHTYNGSSIMHVLTKAVLTEGGEEEWVLLCKPKKRGIYNYMGFRVVIGCAVCLRLRNKQPATPPAQPVQPVQRTGRLAQRRNLSGSRSVQPKEQYL